MKRYYSKSTGCCYLQGIHELPDDAKLIDDERFNSVIANPEPGMVRSHDGQGLPILIKAPAKTDDQLALGERRWRDAELAKRQWLRDRHRDELDIGRPTTLTPELFSDVLEYIQALRDWPQSDSFPSAASRPAMSKALAELIAADDHERGVAR